MRSNTLQNLHVQQPARQQYETQASILTNFNEMANVYVDKNAQKTPAKNESDVLSPDYRPYLPPSTYSPFGPYGAPSQPNNGNYDQNAQIKKKKYQYAKLYRKPKLKQNFGLRSPYLTFNAKQRKYWEAFVPYKNRRSFTRVTHTPTTTSTTSTTTESPPTTVTATTPTTPFVEEAEVVVPTGADRVLIRWERLGREIIERG